ncbi:MAG TPA: hypothetical protein VGU71_00605 [Candidatus Dormibacteraeota bacterium]|nr:hypothetical protein [Candidatus Dormibacteraeota bacterium]
MRIGRPAIIHVAADVVRLAVAKAVEEHRDQLAGSMADGSTTGDPLRRRPPKHLDGVLALVPTGQAEGVE